MVRISLPILMMLAACTPSPQKAAMPDPTPEPKIATDKPLADSPAGALGRRTLSTAFVRVGADGHLTVELRDGRILVLRNVVMNASNYCGDQVSGGSVRGKYCGGYGDVATARPGGGDHPALVDPKTLEPAGKL